MFDSLSERLGTILDRLTRRGALSEADVDAALREVRRALLEADVALDVVRAFIDRVKTHAVGVDVIKSVTPGQMVVKIVHDQLIETLGSQSEPVDLNAPAPIPIMLVGLQGSGKTTTAAKLAKRLSEQARRKVLMASLDVRRPAAMEQLAVLGRQVGIDTLPVVAGQQPPQIAQRALQAGRLGGYDVVILDTAGRTTLDEAMMAEAAEVKRAANPHEVLLVADALTGQDAVTLARSFNERVGLTGIVLTRIDGDGRGGAALSMRAVTGKPIKLMGTGEQIDAIEDFHPARIADRILGMGDIVTLVEKAQASFDENEAKRLEKKVRKEGMDLNDFLNSMRQIQKMGPLEGILKMLPGVNTKALKQMKADPKRMKHVEAIVLSMTAEERKNPGIINGSRRLRIAKGAGRPISDVNRLLDQFREMQKMMKKMAGGGRMGMPAMPGMFGR
jgi:signal recognition particle subunit SRP54